VVRSSTTKSGGMCNYPVAFAAIPIAKPGTEGLEVIVNSTNPVIATYQGMAARLWNGVRSITIEYPFMLVGMLVIGVIAAGVVIALLLIKLRGRKK
jgi:hypothetical protein